MGQNDGYKIIRNQILVIEPLPNTSNAYSMLQRVEKQRDVQVNIIETTSNNSSALFTRNQFQNQSQKNDKRYIYIERYIQNARSQTAGKQLVRFYKKNEKKDRFCTYYSQTGHSKEICFRIHGFSDQYKELKEKKIGSISVAINEQNMTNTGINSGEQNMIATISALQDNIKELPH